MRRQLQVLGIASALTIMAAAGLGASAGPAMAAEPDSACASSASNANCDGVTVTLNSDDVCWNDARPVHVPGNGQVSYDANGYKFTTYLMYSPTCKSNFALTTGINDSAANTMTFSNKVRRHAGGPDGPYLMEHAGWHTAFPSSGDVYSSISPMVYSPDNTAQACISTPADDQAACTAYI
jgi:hypothetical protein